MIEGLWPSKKAEYDAKKKEKQEAKTKENTRLPADVVKELELCSSTIGQKHHQIKCLEHEREQYTAKMNELLLELKSSRMVHGDAQGSEQINVVP